MDGWPWAAWPGLPDGGRAQGPCPGAVSGEATGHLAVGEAGGRRAGREQLGLTPGSGFGMKGPAMDPTHRMTPWLPAWPLATPTAVTNNAAGWPCGVDGRTAVGDGPAHVEPGREAETAATGTDLG